jgi:MFS family permease
VRLPFFYGWVVVAVAFVTMGLGVNARTAFSLLFPPLLDEFGWERGLTAGVFSLGFVVATAFMPWLGWLLDRRGPRVVILLGVALVAAGLALAPLVREPWHLYATLGILVSGGTFCLGYTGHAQFLPNWFVRRRGLAVGVAFSGVGVGSIVLMPWLGWVIGQGGWRRACWAMALVLVVALVPLNLVFPRRRPEDLGLRPDGDPAPRAAESVRAHPANVVDPVWAAVDWTLARAARTARFWWLGATYVTGLFAWYAVQVHQTKYLLEIGFAPETAAWALGFVPFTGIVGQIALGWLSDRVGREWAWTLACAGFAVCYLALLAMRAHPTGWLLAVMVASQGVLGYGMASVFGAMPAELFQGRHYGTVFGTLSLGSGLGGALGPWATGALHDLSGSYVPAFWLAVACCATSTVTVWLAAPRKVRAVAGRVRPA